jgi:hypothetical protein
MFRKLRVVLGVKGLLCLASLIVVALALVSYTATVTIAPTTQFTIGATTATWTIYVNDLDQLRYLPGTGTPAGSQQPGAPTDSNPNTFAFKVVTDSGRVCAVNITLTSAVDSSKFSKFEIRVMRWNSTASAWQGETLYAGPTGSTTKSFINGLMAGDCGYVHHPASLTRYYLIKVTYSYDLVDATTSITVTFQYTPLPQASF